MAVEIEEWVEHGHRWRREPAEAWSSFVVGCDLGQSQDYTAIAILKHHSIPLSNWTITRDDKLSVTRQDAQERFDVVHLERMKLGTSYVEVVEHLRELLSRRPLSDEDTSLVIDESGVGKAVGDMIDASGLSPIRVSITAGSDATRIGGRRWSVSKSLLVSGVDAKLHTGELRFADALVEAGAMQKELLDFRRHTTAAGRMTYQARGTEHDDLVLAVAIALWRAVERRKRRVVTGYVRGLNY